MKLDFFEGDMKIPSRYCNFVTILDCSFRPGFLWIIGCDTTRKIGFVL
jgi:hypothetical protein